MSTEGAVAAVVAALVLAAVLVAVLVAVAVPAELWLGLMQHLKMRNHCHYLPFAAAVVAVVVAVVVVGFFGAHTSPGAGAT